MLKKLSLVVLLCAAMGTLFAAETSTAEVDTSLLDKAKAEKYIDNKSPVSWRLFNTGKQIRDMGRKVGAEVRYQAEVNKTEFPFSSGYPAYKYKAARVFPGDKAGADILYIGRLSKVDTFKNLNRVVSGYIEAAYNIPMEKADIIAQKVCYWNTNHYNDRAYFTQNFQHRVVEVFSNRTKIIGLARSYKNWPGKTRIVIPFVLIKETVPEAVEPAAPAPAPAPEPAPVVTPQPEQAPIDTPDEPAKAGLFGLPLIALIIIGIIAVALIALIVFLIKYAVDKKRNNSDESDQQ